MGQYWLPVNLDKKEFIHPHELGTGLKLWEQLANGDGGVGAALIILCAAMPEPRGGGDLDAHDGTVVGRWAGDRIALVGDYAETADLAPEHEADTIYTRCNGSGATADYTNITSLVIPIIEKELDGNYVGTGWREFTRNAA